MPISLLKRAPPRIVEVEHQARLVELNPVGASGSKPAQHIDVNRQQTFEQRECIKVSVPTLRKPEIADRPKQHRTRLIAEGLRLQVFINWLERRKHKTLLPTELRHYVVIVGIEPLGHLLRPRAMGMTCSSVI